MRRTATIVFALIALCAQAPADDSALPNYRVLPCATRCATSTPPVPVDHPKPLFPTNELVREGGYVEGLVTIRYTIGIDGHVKDASVQLLLGPQRFADVALESVRARTFKPATVDGKPVEVGATVSFMFRDDNYTPGARPDIITAYRDSVAAIKAAKLDEALAIVRKAQARERLNFYERTMLMYVAGLLYNDQKDYVTARVAIDNALLNNGEFLDRRYREGALRLGIVLNARAGEFARALSLAQKLGAFVQLKPDDPALKVVADIHAAVDGPNPFAVEGKIPPAAESNSWHHILMRRTFAFDQTAGLTKFQMSCDQQAIESPVKDGAEWHVPASWSNCHLFVEGTPGTAFRLIEFK